MLEKPSTGSCSVCGKEDAPYDAVVGEYCCAGECRERRRAEMRQRERRSAQQEWSQAIRRIWRFVKWTAPVFAAGVAISLAFPANSPVIMRGAVLVMAASAVYAWRRR